MAETVHIRVNGPTAMAAARRGLRNRLDGWGCSNVENIILVFSELVTNATIHSANTSTAVITYGPPNVRIEVHDASHSKPELRHGTGPGGFGLRIVNQLSDRWGWDRTSTGKVVWSIVPCTR